MKWWARQVSNLRPPACKAGALPLSYAPGSPVRRAGGWQAYLLAAGPAARRTPVSWSASAMALRQACWSRASPGPFISAKRTTPALSMTKVPRLAKPRDVVEDPVRLGDRAVRPEVGQQRELVALAVGPDLVAVGRVDADRQHLDVVVDVVVEVVPHLAQLALAGAGEGERVEDQQHGALAPGSPRAGPPGCSGPSGRSRAPRRQPRWACDTPRVESGERRQPATRRRAAVGRAERRGLLLGLGPSAQTRRAPLQSLPALTVEVCCRPAVGADSLISLGSTCPSRPAFGVSSHTTPLSASGPRASTSSSNRSPSPSRYQSSTASTTSSVSSSTRSPHAVGQGVAEILVDVVVVPHLHDDHARLDAEPVRQAAYAVRPDQRSRSLSRASSSRPCSRRRTDAVSA